MDVTVTDSGPCRKTLAIVVPPEKIKDHVHEVFKSAAQQVEIKGFRKGKVPKSVLQKRFGDEIMSEAKLQLINQCFQQALQDHDVSPLGEPELDGIDEAPLDDSAPLEFQIHVDVRPEFELGRVRGIEVPRGEDAVTDEDLDNALGQLANEKRTLRPVEEPVEDGDFVKTDVVYKKEGGDVVHEQSGARLNTNIPIAGTDPQVFADCLRGAEAGADKPLEVEIQFPDTFEKEEVRGQKGMVEITVQEVLRVVPAPIDDELAKTYDFESMDKLKEDLNTRLIEEKKRANLARQEEDIFNVLISENPFDLPASMVDQQAQAALAQFGERMKQAKVDEAEIEAKLKEAEDEAREDATRRVRLFFLLDAVAAKEKLFVTETDVEAELREIASQHQVEVDQVRSYYEENKLLGDLRLGIKERKVRSHLRESAKLTD